MKRVPIEAPASARAASLGFLFALWTVAMAMLACQATGALIY